MADPRVFTLIGSFEDRITPSLKKINESLDKVKANLESVSKATKPLKNDFKELADLSNKFSTSLKSQASDIKDITAAMKAMRNEMGRVNRAYRAANRNRNIVPPPPPPPRTPRFATPPSPPPPPRTPRYRYAEPPMPPGGGGGDRRGGYGGGRQSVTGEVISANLISSAIIQGFHVGVGILQRGMSAAFGAFAERSRDQLEDIAAAGGIFSAAKFAGATGLPTSFQGAMDMQDKINKEMAAIASNLPGTTHDYVMNSRRLVDTTAQVMARDTKAFAQLAKDLTGKMNMNAEEAFNAVNVEISKATTLLEKINPSKTVIPMTQIVEDMMKQEQVSIGGLRRYVAFRRGTTFEAALTRNLEELNKEGAGTAGRLKMIVKVLKEAVPSEMITQFGISVAGVTEGFRSAFLDPDVGLFGLSRNLSFEITKFNRETGKPMVDKLGREMTETSNFFKMFSEVMGTLGNLLNTSILPGLIALYNPFDSIAKTFEKLRTFGFKVYERQQEYTKYFEDLSTKYGMRKEDFKVFEKGGVSVLLDILQGYKLLDDNKYRKIVSEMEKGGSPEEIAARMKNIYSEILPAILESPFFKDIGKTIGEALAAVFKEIAKIMKAILTGNYGVSEFTKAFYDAGGMDAINEILMYVAEGVGKFLFGVVQTYVGALAKAVGSGNFAAAGVLGALGLVFGAPAIAGIKVIASGMKMLVDAFRFLLNSRVVPATVKDLGKTTRITDPRKMLPAAKGASGPLATANKGLSTFGNAVRSIGSYLKGVGPRFMGFFKGFLGKLSIFGAVITSVISLFQGKDLARSLAEGAGPLLGAALGAALIPFLGPIGPMIGAAIGGWVGSSESVVNKLAEVFQQLGDSIAGITSTLAAMGSDLLLFVQSLTGARTEADALRQLLASINVILFPLTATLDLINVAVHLLRIAFLEAAMFIDGWTGGKNQAELTKRYEEANKSLTRLIAANDEKYAKISRLKGDKAILGGKQVTWDGTQWTGADGKPASPKPGAPAAKPSVAPTPVPPKPGAPATAQVPAANPAAVAAQTQAITATSTNIQQLNQKAATQIAHAAQIKSAAVKTQNNTTTANTTLGNIRAGMIAVSNKLSSLQSAILGDLNNIQAGVSRISSLLASGALKVQTDFGLGGGALGGGDGGPPVFGAAASKFGLQMTSGYRPGDPGYHGLNRARDYSNGSGPTPQMQMFAQFMANTFGRNLKELIYTPLGFSIKNGTKVPPYAQSTHMDHVHVAWAYGPSNPVAFESMGAAQQWERSMVPGSMKVASVTANSGEGFGGSPVNVTNNISISQQPGQSADELAAIVAIKIGEAVADARAASIFV